MKFHRIHRGFNPVRPQFAGKSTKYGNRKTHCFNRHLHDSVKEAAYCNLLMAKQQGKEIKRFEVSKSFELIEKFKSGDENIRAIAYIADFVVYHNDGTIEIVDIKGGKASVTSTFLLKWKLLKYKFRNNPAVKLTIVDKAIV